MGRVLDTLRSVLDRQIRGTEIGKIVMPGPTYLGIWARDTAIVSLGLVRLGKTDLARELLQRYWSYQITAASDPATFVFRNKTRAGWMETDAFQPTRSRLLAEEGAFPTSVYIQTPDFPAGTREVYANRADPDGAAWLVIALGDYVSHTDDDGLLHDLMPGVDAAVSYLAGRDDDGDHLLEQGPNEDWADTLLRRGKVSYTQALWFHCLGSAQKLFARVGNTHRAEYCRQEREAVREAIMRVLMTPHGYFANYVAGEGVSLRRSLDTALLVAFGVVGPEEGRGVLEVLSTLGGPFGPAVIEPGYAPNDTGPSRYPPGQYQNEGIWPWISSYLALAWACIGDRPRAREVICSIFPHAYDTTHEWIDGLTGQAFHPDFATAAGALAWAISEADLAA